MTDNKTPNYTTDDGPTCKGNATPNHHHDLMISPLPTQNEHPSMPHQPHICALQPRSRRNRRHPEPDWSAMVRAQIRGSQRTGQACDRCKVSNNLPSYHFWHILLLSLHMYTSIIYVFDLLNLTPGFFLFQLRKLRCDPHPDGCAPCTYISKPCCVTDRVTGETYIRGTFKRMQEKIDALQTQVHILTEERDLLQNRLEELRILLGSYADGLVRSPDSVCI